MKSEMNNMITKKIHTLKQEYKKNETDLSILLIDLGAKIYHSSQEKDLSTTQKIQLSYHQFHFLKNLGEEEEKNQQKLKKYQSINEEINKQNDYISSHQKERNEAEKETSDHLISLGKEIYLQHQLKPFLDQILVTVIDKITSLEEQKKDKKTWEKKDWKAKITTLPHLVLSSSTILYQNLAKIFLEEQKKDHLGFEMTMESEAFQKKQHNEETLETLKQKLDSSKQKKKELKQEKKELETLDLDTITLELEEKKEMYFHSIGKTYLEENSDLEPDSQNPWTTLFKEASKQSLKTKQVKEQLDVAILSQKKQTLEEKIYHKMKKKEEIEQEIKVLTSALNQLDKSL